MLCYRSELVSQKRMVRWEYGKTKMFSWNLDPLIKYLYGNQPDLICICLLSIQFFFSLVCGYVKNTKYRQTSKQPRFSDRCFPRKIGLVRLVPIHNLRIREGQQKKKMTKKPICVLDRRNFFFSFTEPNEGLYDNYKRTKDGMR